ncbi:MAG: hypothetical protein K5829_05815 [Treponema sp.]|nr:hypothetical protein [Treponema sp.]
MSDQIGNAMKIAINALKSGNANECINFCNQVLLEDSNFENAKVLKGAAILNAYTYEDAENLSEEAFGVWKTINNISLITDSYIDAALDVILEFRDKWEADNTRFYKDSQKSDNKEVKDAGMKYYSLGKSAIKSYMENIARIKWLQSYPPFLAATVEFVKHQIASIERVTYAKILIEANKGKDGEVGELIKQIEEVFKKLTIRRWIKIGIIGTIVLVVAIFLIVKVASYM